MTARRSLDAIDWTLTQEPHEPDPGGRAATDVLLLADWMIGRSLLAGAVALAGCAALPRVGPLVAPILDRASELLALALTALS